METTSTIDDQSLIEFVAGILPAAETFPTTARPLMKGFARSLAPELPPDLHDEVVSQSLEYLIEYGKQFEPARGTAKAFLKLMAKQAARTIRANYRAPGCRTRPSRDELQRQPKIVPIWTLEIESPAWVENLETTSEVRSILRRAPVRIARALVLIYFAGETVSATAKALGMSRFTLSREISGFTRAVQAGEAA